MSPLPQLSERLRREPGTFTVPRSTPVLFFGDLFTARVATVGLNPSDREFLDRNGEQLAGPLRRFETLDSLGSTNRTSLTDAQCDQAITTMRGYFGDGKPIYGWFRALARVTDGLGFDFTRGEVAHLDLVQEATKPTWSGLPPEEQTRLLDADLPFLRWQITSFPLELVVCTGKTVSNHVCSGFGVEITEQGELARVKWWLGHAQLDGREVGFCGWNLPLARPTGLGVEGERHLGRLFAMGRASR